eukprot:comp20594_c0_seq1/m.26532 comp20594_c0_seq1/g.26532  ORF comp20594_c0_seq1/g.26532 comp20594_c0_seq1/m.26532 type:complete len:309 (-) comp20594_c0_seq1:215-1141(-)
MANQSSNDDTPMFQNIYPSLDEPHYPDLEQYLVEHHAEATPHHVSWGTTSTDGLLAEHSGTLEVPTSGPVHSKHTKQGSVASEPGVSSPGQPVRRIVSWAPANFPQVDEDTVAPFPPVLSGQQPPAMRKRGVSVGTQSARSRGDSVSSRVLGSKLTASLGDGSTIADAPEPWPAARFFYPECSREAADEMLIGQDVGTFMLRHSSSTGHVSLSIRMPRYVKHYLLVGKLDRLHLAGKQECFSSITDLVDFYFAHPISGNGMKLQCPMNYTVRDVEAKPPPLKKQQWGKNMKCPGRGLENYYFLGRHSD